VDDELAEQLGFAWSMRKQMLAAYQQQLEERDQVIAALEQRGQQESEAERKNRLATVSALRAAVNGLNALVNEPDAERHIREERVAMVRRGIDAGLGLLDKEAAPAEAESPKEQRAPAITVGSRSRGRTRG
jgi:hypothetical protein